MLVNEVAMDPHPVDSYPRQCYNGLNNRIPHEIYFLAWQFNQFINYAGCGSKVYHHSQTTTDINGVCM